MIANQTKRLVHPIPHTLVCNRHRCRCFRVAPGDTSVQIVEDLCVGEPHEDFRLWLSSGPHPKFPISILRRGLKMTTEPPAGLRANVSTLYNIVSPVRDK